MSDLIGKRVAVTQKGWRRIASEYNLCIATVKIVYVEGQCAQVRWRNSTFGMMLRELILPKR